MWRSCPPPGGKNTYLAICPTSKLVPLTIMTTTNLGKDTGVEVEYSFYNYIVDYAIEWAVRSGQVRNLDSARVSMPGQLKCMDTGHCSTQDVQLESISSDRPIEQSSHTSNFIKHVDDSIPEEPEENKTMRYIFD